MRLFLFVGEKPSTKALAMNVSWKDGRLAAKQLFDALLACGIEPSQHLFANYFSDLPDCRKRKPGIVSSIEDKISKGYIVVGMGNVVSEALSREGIPHIRLIHPAARGKIRKKSAYAAHVRSKLGSTI